MLNSCYVVRRSLVLSVNLEFWELLTQSAIDQYRILNISTFRVSNRYMWRMYGADTEVRYKLSWLGAAKGDVEVVVVVV